MFLLLLLTEVAERRSNLLWNLVLRESELHMEDKALPIKCVLLGQVRFLCHLELHLMNKQTCVGKSSLVLRFVQDKFFPHTEGTIGGMFSHLHL